VLPTRSAEEATVAIPRPKAELSLVGDFCFWLDCAILLPKGASVFGRHWSAFAYLVLMSASNGRWEFELFRL
jgi:hypothetical protein